MSLPAPVPPTSSSAVTEMIRLAQVPGEYAFYRWGNVAINIWSTQPTASNVKCLADLTETAGRARDDGCPIGRHAYPQEVLRC